MALPTQDDLKKLDYNYFGQPFCWLSLKTTLDTDTLDYNYFGQPFWAVMPTEAPPSICRMIIISAEDRVFAIPQENRVFAIPACEDGGK